MSDLYLDFHEVEYGTGSSVVLTRAGNLRIAVKPTKTKKWIVVSRSGDGLGVIKWYGHWRQYCFYPNDGTIWSTGCLEQVSAFLHEHKNDRREK